MTIRRILSSVVILVAALIGMVIATGVIKTYGGANNPWGVVLSLTALVLGTWMASGIRTKWLGRLLAAGGTIGLFSLLVGWDWVSSITLGEVSDGWSWAANEALYTTLVILGLFIVLVSVLFSLGGTFTKILTALIAVPTIAAIVMLGPVYFPQVISAMSGTVREAAIPGYAGPGASPERSVPTRLFVVRRTGAPLEAELRYDDSIVVTTCAQPGFYQDTYNLLQASVGGTNPYSLLRWEQEQRGFRLISDARLKQALRVRAATGAPPPIVLLQPCT